MMEGLNIIGVQFRRAGRIYDFAAGDLDLKVGDDVVVETERGPSLAKVATIRYEEPGGNVDKELKAILRMASRRDLDETRKLTPEAATKFTRDRVDRLGIKMTVLQSEVQFGGNKVIVYFSAPGRVDFRELVKELATGLKARVELKQVGARDEAKLVGGIGICGREFCCSSFLREFVPVSIKMAKNQNLALNPSKVSGGCGRLLCCLTYENDLYTELRRKLPPKGTRVRALEDGVMGHVLKGDVLNQVVLIDTTEGRLLSVPLKNLEIVEANAGEAEDSEADTWGEDIDMAALAGLEDEGAKPRPPKGGGGGGGGGGRGPGGGGGGGRGPGGGGGGGRGPGGGGQQQARGKDGRPGGGDRGPRGDRGQGGGGQQGQGGPKGDRGPKGERGPKGDRPPRDDRQSRGPREDRGTHAAPQHPGEDGLGPNDGSRTPEAQPPIPERKDDGGGDEGGGSAE